MRCLSVLILYLLPFCTDIVPITFLYLYCTYYLSVLILYLLPFCTYIVPITFLYLYCTYYKKVCSYTERYPVGRTVQRAVYTSSHGRPVHSDTRLHWEEFSHAAVTARRLFVHISTIVFSLVLIYTKFGTGSLD